MNKWITLGFLCGLFLIYNIDRAILGVLAIPIQESLGLTDVQFGCLSSGIFWTYAVVAPFAGMAGDRFDKRKLLGVTSLLWSLMTLLAGFSGGFWSMFLLLSVAVVIPQACFFPTSNALISECHDETRTRALSCLLASSHLGWLLSGVAVALILSVFGCWRCSYFIFGGAGLALAAVFLFLSARPERNGSRETVANKACAKPTLGASAKAFFGNPAVLLVAVSYIMVVFTAYGYGAWAPKFIAKKFAVAPSAAGTGVMLCGFGFAFAGILAAGWLTDRYVKKIPAFRLWAMIATLFVAAPSLVFFSFAPTFALALSGAAVFGFGRGAYGANPIAAIFDVVDSRCRAGAVAFLNVTAALVGSLSPVGMGALSQHFGMRGLEIGFVCLGVSLAVAVAALVGAVFLKRSSK